MSPERVRAPLKDILPDRLVLTFSAHQDFNAAYGLYTQFPNGKEKPFVGIRIANAQVVLGLDPTPTLGEVRQAASILDSWNRAGIHRSIAQLQVKMGDIPAAFEAVEKIRGRDKRFILPFGFIDIARVILDQGNDPNAAITRAIQAVDEGGLEASRQAYLYAEIASLQARAGLDPRKLLDAAVKKLETRKRPSYCYEHLAKRYADAGFYDEALELVPRITQDNRERTEQAQINTVWMIAEKQAKAGLVAEAMQTVKTTDSAYAIADVAAEVARAAAKQGANGQQWIEEGLTHIAVYEGSIKGDPYENHYQARIASMLATIGEAQASIGENSQATFENARAKALLSPNPRHRIQAFIDIAKAQDASSIDASGSFQLAIEAADSYLDEGEEAVMAEVEQEVEQEVFEQLMAYEDIATAALGTGYDGLLEQLFEKLDKFDPDFPTAIKEAKIKLLIKRAELKAEEGLSRDELRGMDQESIQAVLTSGNEQAIRALQYFGLAA